MANAAPQNRPEPSLPQMRGPWLRFAPAQEQAFRRQYEANGLGSRRVLLALAAVLVALTPLYDRALLLAPPAFLTVSRLLQFGVQVPVLLLAFAVTTWPRTRRWSVPVTIVAALVTGASLMAQRVVGLTHDFHVPHDFAAFAAAMTFFLARIRFTVVLPWLLLLMVGSTAAELFTFQGQLPAAIYDSISAWMLFAMAATGAWLLERLAREQWATQQLLEHQASHDALTGLHNRRQFHELLDAAARDAIREGRTLSLVLLDLDDFKAYNDHYGHPAGDEALRRIGGWLAGSTRRPRDFCGRIGGEEFAAVWFDARTQDARRLAEHLRAGVGALGIRHAMSSTLPVMTASAGFVQVRPPRGACPAATVEWLMRQADGALYAAKRQGRNLQCESTADFAAAVDAPGVGAPRPSISRG